jgi:hypothetical protein
LLLIEFAMFDISALKQAGANLACLTRGNGNLAANLLDLPGTDGAEALPICAATAPGESLSLQLIGKSP